jgi:hypothetical protein
MPRHLVSQSYALLMYVRNVQQIRQTESLGRGHQAIQDPTDFCYSRTLRTSTRSQIREVTICVWSLIESPDFTKPDLRAKLRAHRRCRHRMRQHDAWGHVRQQSPSERRLCKMFTRCRRPQVRAGVVPSQEHGYRYRGHVGQVRFQSWEQIR